MSAASPLLTTPEARAVALWRSRQIDTYDIAQRTGLKEWQVCRAIHADRDRRRAGR